MGESVIINKTPHLVNMVRLKDGVEEDGEEYEIYQTFPECPKKEVVRLETTRYPTKSVKGVPISYTKFGSVRGLPNYIPNTYYIVSSMVKNMFPHRLDLLVPAGVVKNKSGIAIGCLYLGI